MIEKNDWRITNQEEYLKNRTLKKEKYSCLTEKWDHDHCEFCWEKFSSAENDLHEGYCTLDKGIWICENCYNDFKEMFNWQLDI